MPLHDETRPGVAIVGPGAVGAVLGTGLAEAGYPVLAVLGRTRARAARLARRVGAPVASTRWSDLPDDVRFIVCCVPDDAVAAVATALADVAHAWSETTVAHTSGLLTADVLAPLAERGARTMSFHPLQTFADPDATLDGVFVALEGEDEALRLGRAAAINLGARYLELPAAAKPAYHLAATVASNFFVTLVALVQEILHGVGIEPETSLALVQPLVEQTWGNLLRHTPETALTGPIVRGDVGTVSRHGDVVAAHYRHLMPVYAALAAETVRVAVRAGRLDPDRAIALLDELHGRLVLDDEGS